MNLVKRAILYIARKWRKTLLVFLILFAVAALVLSGLAISDAQEQKTAELRGTTGASFTVGQNLANAERHFDEKGNSYYSEKPITDEMIASIAGVEGISAYNAYTTATMYCYTQDGKYIDMTDLGEFENILPVDEVDCISYVFGCMNSEYQNNFTSGKFELTEGSHVTSDCENSIVMSRRAAEDNGLKIGDTIQVKYDAGEPVIELTIIGLFDIIADEQDFDMSDSITAVDYMAYSFIDVNSMKALLANHEDYQYVDSADFIVSDPEKLESIIQEVQSISSIDWNTYSITVNDEVYQRVSTSISDTSSLISVFIWIAVCVSMVIVVLLLSMWMRSRKREIGVLLAIGLSKLSIIMQYILETLLIAVFAFPCGYLVSNYVAGRLGGLFGKTAETIAVTSQHFVLVSGIGALLLVLAVLFSCIPILRYKPREILAQME